MTKHLILVSNAFRSAVVTYCRNSLSGNAFNGFRTFYLNLIGFKKEMSLIICDAYKINLFNYYCNSQGFSAHDVTVKHTVKTWCIANYCDDLLWSTQNIISFNSATFFIFFRKRAGDSASILEHQRSALNNQNLTGITFRQKQAIVAFTDYTGPIFRDTEV